MIITSYAHRQSKQTLVEQFLVFYYNLISLSLRSETSFFDVRDMCLIDFIGRGNVNIFRYNYALMFLFR